MSPMSVLLLQAPTSSGGPKHQIRAPETRGARRLRPTVGDGLEKGESARHHHPDPSPGNPRRLPRRHEASGTGPLPAALPQRGAELGGGPLRGGTFGAVVVVEAGGA